MAKSAPITGNRPSARVIPNNGPQPGPEEPIILEDSELENAMAQLAQAREQITARDFTISTLQQELQSLRAKLASNGDVKVKADDELIRFPFPLQDPNHAGRIVQSVFSMRFPEGIIAAHHRCRLFSLSEGLRVKHARISDGNFVETPAHAIRWLLDNMRLGDKDVAPVPKQGQRY